MDIRVITSKTQKGLKRRDFEMKQGPLVFICKIDKIRLVSENLRFGGMSKNGGFYTTHKYKQELTDLVSYFRLAKNGNTIRGKIKANISVKTRKDTQNIHKPIFDALELARIIENDNQVWKYTVEKTGIPKRAEPESLFITLEEL